MPLFRNGANAMERIREDLLSRARSEQQHQEQQQPDLEQGLPPRQLQPEGEVTERSQNQGRPRPTMPTLFGEIPREEYAREARVVPTADQIESPKSPDVHNGSRGSPLTRFSLPSISQIWPRGQTRELNEHAAHPAIESHSPPPGATQDWNIPLPPEPPTHSRPTIRPVSSQYPETNEIETAETRLSPEERRHRRRQRRHQGGQRARDGRRKRRGKPPQRFLYCFPWVKSRRMRAYILRCFVSGLFLVILLTVCKLPDDGAARWGGYVLTEPSSDLALSVSNQISMGEFTIVLILIVILATLFFCYGLIKLCMLVVRRDRAREQRTADSLEGHGYAIPSEPIPVTLARDEEAAGLESETSKMTPPAYGIWRESVVSSSYPLP